jgi:hypothetical protein
VLGYSQAFGFGSEEPAEYPDSGDQSNGFGGSEDGFGFGDSFQNFQSFENNGSSAVTVSGDISASVQFFFNDASIQDIADIFSGSLAVKGSTKLIDAFVGVDVATQHDSSGVKLDLSLDELYIDAYMNKFSAGIGYKKLTWGKADSFGPLDIVNPFDYTNFGDMLDIRGMKIARPLLNASWSSGNSKVEGVFVPFFLGHRFGTEGRWAPAQLASIPNAIIDGINNANNAAGGSLLTPDQIAAIAPAISAQVPETFNFESSEPKYMQAGLRFSTTTGPVDWGLQYFYGVLPRPTVDQQEIANSIGQIAQSGGSVPDGIFDSMFKYNRYHQLGADYAQVLGGFNIRAEAAFHLMENYADSKGPVHPFLGWSVGFDRNIFSGITLNVQGSGAVHLFDEGIDTSGIGIKQGKRSATRLLAMLQRNFLRDELTVQCAGIYNIEDKDFLVLPSVEWTRNNLSLGLTGGFFGGDSAGEFGQFVDNSFLNVKLGYSF